MKKEKEKKKKPYVSTWNNIRWSIRGQLKYQPAALGMQILYIPVNVGLAWAAIYLPSLVVAQVLEGRALSHAACSVGLLMLAILCANILYHVLDYYAHTVDQLYTNKIRDLLCQKALRLFYQTYEKKEIGDLFQRAEMTTQTWNGVQPVKDMTWHTRSFVESLICYALFGTVISFVSPWMLLLLTLAPAVNWFCARAYQKWEYENRGKWSELDRKIRYITGKTAQFSAAKDIRIYGMAGWMRQMYKMLCEEHAIWNKKRIWKNYFSRIADLAVILLRDGAAYAVLIAMVRAGEITADQFVLYFAAVSSFAAWIGNILNEWNQMRGTSLELCDLREYLEYPDEDGDGTADIREFLENTPEIVFDHVSFRYDGAKEDTLHDICLTLHAGEKLALVGANGAGKTTLVKLMCGLYKPTSGEIRLSACSGSAVYNGNAAYDGKAIRDGNVSRSETAAHGRNIDSGEKAIHNGNTSDDRNASYSGNAPADENTAANANTASREESAKDERYGVPVGHFCRQDYYKLFSVIFQNVNPMFFSLAELVSGCEEKESDLGRAKECMCRAGLMEKLASLPDGIHTKLDKQVNENGIELSGGELQKLMLARALYKDAPVLVLDEPTAALDPIAESNIYEEYKNMTAGKSSLFISHRLASTRFCDRILYLQDGKIVEEGSHDSLIKAGGEYAKLYEIQSCWYNVKGAEVL